MKLFKRILVMMMLFVLIPLRVEAATASITSSLNIVVGKKGTISIKSDAPGGMIQGTITGGNSKIALLEGKTDFLVDTGMDENKSPSYSVSVKGISAGTTTFIVKVEGQDIKGNRFSKDQEVKVTVKNASTPKPDPNPITPPKLDNTEEDKKNPPSKTEEQIAAEKLAERQKKPLIKDFDVVSKSDRYKDEVLKTQATEHNLFNYRYVLPRNVESFALDIRGIDDSVSLTYDKEHTFEVGKNSIEVAVKAVQDKVTQDFNIIIEKPLEVNFDVEFEGSTYSLVEDSQLNTQMEKFGFKRMAIDPLNDASGSYFEVEGNKVLFTANDSNEARWFVTNEEFKPVKEVVLAGADEVKPIFLVNEVLAEDDKRKLNNNSFEAITVSVPESIKNMDTTLKYKDSINGWKYDDEGIITHTLSPNGESKLVHFDNEGNSVEAFVSFDGNSNGQFGVVTWVFLGLWIATLLGFIIYWRYSDRKLKALLDRRSNI